MRTALLGLLAMFGTASSASAANIAYFSDPVYTDETEELVHLSDAMTGLGHTVIPFSGITGVAWTTALATADVVVLPENEGLNIADSLSVDARKALVGFLLSGNGAIFSGDSPRRSATLLNRLFGFGLAGSGSQIPSTLDAAAAAGTVFATGPATLPGSDAVFQLTTNTLPPGSLGLYKDATNTTLFATTVGGTGRIAFLAYDWFEPTNPPEWVQALGIAINYVNAAVATPLRIAYFRDGNYVDLSPSSTGEAEGLNLEETLTSMGHTLTPFVGVAPANWQAALANADVIVISEQEAGSLAPDLPGATETVIAEFVLSGGGFLVTDSASQTAQLYNDLFGLTIAQGGYGSVYSLNAPDAAGTPFAAGPPSIPAVSATDSFGLASLPARALTHYATGTETAVMTMAQGFGTLAFLGWDWFGASPSFPWYGALSSALVQCGPRTGLAGLIGTANAGADAVVTADLSGFGGLTTAALKFRKGGDGPFQTLDLVQDSPTTWRATVPASFATVTGIQTFLELADAAHTVTEPPAAPAGGLFHNFPVALANHGFASLPAGGYQLRGVPLQAANANPVAVFDELGGYNIKNWRYGTFNGSAYVEPNAAAFATPGQGFWIVSKDARAIATPGTSTNLAGPVVLTLRQGFNQIANPFAFPVDFADVVRPAEVEANLIGFNGSAYVPNVATLLPGEGYWIKNNGPGNRNISIPPLGAGIAAAAPRPVVSLAEGAEWALRVDARAGRFADEGNLFGARVGASEGRDAFDLSEPPPAPEGWVRAGFASSSDGELLCDWRPAGNEGATWQVSFASDQAGEDFSIDLSVERALPEGWSVLVFEGAREVELDEAMQISGRVGSTTAPRVFTVSVGSSSFLGSVRTDAETTVTTFSLAAPFPNPSSAGVSIDLAVPSPVADARVEVFDVQGRRVQTLLEGAVERGIQRVAWDGRTSTGERASAGVYFMKARAGSFSASRKVVLLP